MTDPALPPWADDPLSTVLFQAGQNVRLSSLKFPDIYALLQRLYGAFLSVTEITANDRHATLLPARFLMARAQAGFLAAIRLGMSGQVVEAYMPLRGLIEATWYALHIAKDPEPPSRGMTWLRRNTDGLAMARCKTEFTVANVRATHKAIDPVAAGVLDTIYGWTIDLGAHPNAQGVLTAMKRRETDEAQTFDAEIISDNPALVVTSLKLSAEAGVGCLKACGLIFPERFKIMGLDRVIEELARATSTLFSGYASRFGVADSSQA